MKKPFTIGFSREGEMDYPVQHEIVYSDSSDNAMWKWIKDNPRDFFRSKSVNESTQEDVEKYGKQPKKVSSCCQAEMIPPMSEDEMEDNYVGSNWRAASCYICKNCEKACEAVDEKIEVVDMKPEQLRKGNILKNQLDGSLIIVKAYDIYCLEEGIDSMIMQPIPITEEWLVKLSVKNTKQINKSCFCVQYNEKKELYEFCLLLNGGIKICLNTFVFVHQLQNLYFALTGEGLTLNK